MFWLFIQDLMNESGFYSVPYKILGNDITVILDDLSDMKSFECTNDLIVITK